MKKEIIAKLDALRVEKRSFMASVENGTGAFDEAAATAKLEEFAKREAELEKQLAELERPVETRSAKTGLTNEDFLKAVQEKRSITIGDNGNINQVKQLFEQLADKDDILNEITFDYGPNASTAIPVLEPGLAEPESAAEGAGEISSDDDAAMITTEIYAKAYVSVLPVTAEALQMGTIDIEAKLPDLFNKAFRKKMHRAMFTGTGTSKDVKGIFVSAAANTAGVTPLAGTVPTITELAGLALKVAQLDEKFELIMNSQTYQDILGDATAGKDIEAYKQSLINNKEIEGVKVRLDARAPHLTTAGTVLVAAVPLSRFHMGVAGQVVITPIKKVGDTKTYFQAEAFFGGCQVTDKDIYSLAIANA